MVSLHTPPLSPSRRKIIPEFLDSSKKRKWEEPLAAPRFSSDQKLLLGAKSMRLLLETEISLETPLPLEWQRCLDIKSGNIYYYNTRTQKRTSRDPRSASPEPPPSHQNHGYMSLDLELNLPCGTTVGKKEKNHQAGGNNLSFSRDDNEKQTDGMMRIPSWLTIEGDDEHEMVTAVCKKCHMLVMMCKSSPACPNCKFMHSPEQSSPILFNQNLNLSCKGFPG